MRTSNKLNYLNETKELIKEVLREKGVEVSDTDTFRSYADKVKSISTAEDLSVELAEQDAAITELEEVANSLPDAGIVNPDVPMDPIDPPVFGFATFKENGEYNAEDYGVDGWSSVKVEVAGSGGGGDLTESNRQLVMVSDMQKSLYVGTMGFNEYLYTDQQLEYIQRLFNYINRGVTA